MHTELVVVKEIIGQKAVEPAFAFNVEKIQELIFQGLKESLDLAVALRMPERGPCMDYAERYHKFLKSS